MTALREIRQRLGLSQSELAKRLKVSQPTITLWENGERKPDIVMVKKIAHIFGVTVDELLAPIKID